MDWPSLSVIIPSYNQGAYIERTLLSILKQRYPGPLEVIVSDGGSTDGTVAVLQRYPQVRWWSGRDRGFVDAVAKGLAAATGEVVAIQSSDDYYLEGAFDKAIRALQQQGPQVAFVTGAEIVSEADGVGYFYGKKLSVSLLRPGALLAHHFFYVPQHCTFVRRAAVDAVGGLREEVDQCADFDLWYRILHFYRGLILPEHLAVYQKHPAQRTQARAELWIESLQRVLDDCEREEKYSRRFKATDVQKRETYRVWQITRHWLVGAPENMEISRMLARDILEHQEQWSDQMRVLARRHSPPEAPEPDPEPDPQPAQVMPDVHWWAKYKDVEDWNRELQERVGEPLHVDRIRSLLLMNTGNSGDTALTTTLLRHVKEVNPDCRITFATPRRLFPVARLCPGVDELVELPDNLSYAWDRRSYCDLFAGRADAIVFVNIAPDDEDLIRSRGFNLLETIWLLAGVPDGMPQQPMRVWLAVSGDPAVLGAVLRRGLGARTHARLLRSSAAKIVRAGLTALRSRSLRASGFKAALANLPRLARIGAGLVSPQHRRRLRANALSRDFVVLSTEAGTLSDVPAGLTGALVRMLREDGRTVLHNVRQAELAAPGTVPLICAYPEFLSLREAGVPFVGWRSGLCDLAANAPAPMCVLYPTTHERWPDPLGQSGFRSMNVECDCLEFVCRRPEDIDRHALLTHLNKTDPGGGSLIDRGAQG